MVGLARRRRERYAPPEQIRSMQEMRMLATAPERLPDDEVERFHRDGFLIIDEGFLAEGTIELLRERFDRLFEGEYATGIQPDEVNWRRGRDPEDLTRQICNGWRADDQIAAQVLSERTGRIAAQLMGYGGARIL
jgi:phytanoyl-CoA hydroxylase